MTLGEDILRILTQAKDEIVAAMQDKGINASGRTARGFAVEQDATGMRLVLRHDETATVECKPRGFGSVEVGTAPLSTLEVGIAGIAKPPRGFYYIIKQWTRDKGLVFASESERQTFSYFTAQKIIDKGTRRHEQPVEVYSEPVKKAKERLNKVISSTIINKISAAVTAVQTNK